MSYRSSYRWYRCMVLPMPNSSNQRHHETCLMIFMSIAACARRRAWPWYHAPMRLRTRLNLVVAGLSAAFVIVLIAAEVQSTRNSVREEIEAANQVASHFLGKLGAAYSAIGGPQLVLQFLQQLGRVRANEVYLLSSTGE